EDIALGPDNKVVTAGRDFQCCVWQQDQLVPRGQACMVQGAMPAPTHCPPFCSDSGTFLGLGTVTGSVAIHIAFSLQRLYYVKEAHGIVVTDVAFIPESRGGRELLAGNEAALLSVAVDSRCKLHLLPSRR
ncbi:PREB protein, partial [Chloroceryle aenea]|nr:PREB protein [Chloroceryle aenea]